MQKQQALNVAVKFCGGCNPLYDRRAILERLQREFPEIVFRFIGTADALGSGQASGKELDDLALVLCGCRNECLDYSRFMGKHGQILVFSEEDCAKATAFLSCWHVSEVRRSEP
jgi:4-hydroxybutyrate CoA-transferase